MCRAGARRVGGRAIGVHLGSDQALIGDVGSPRGELDFSLPSVARVCDCLVGGKDNFMVDRRAAAELIAADPAMPDLVVENRWFSRRVVRHLVAECGITQFIEVGVGLPAGENVHHVTQRHDPAARVVYVDHDPIVVAHGQAVLAENDRIKVVKADLCGPERMLGNLDLRRVIDLSRPVAVLLTPVLAFVRDSDDPGGIVARIRNALAPGSYLALSHACAEARPAQVRGVAEVFRDIGSPCTARSRARIRGFFGDFHLTEPGLTWIAAWRPEKPVGREAAERLWYLGGLARKPSR
jgi:SAM-dependent methyltransferase